MSQRVYIAGPYTKGDVAANVRAAVDAAEQVAKLGHFPYVPHLTHFWHLIHPHDWTFWMALDQEWLLQCDCVIRLPGESRGADDEVALAERHGIPVYYGLDEFFEARPAGGE
jgi:hypothetical protein